MLESLKEEREVNNVLAHQQVLFFQNMGIIKQMCQSIDALVNQQSNLRTYGKEVEEKTFDFIDWQNNCKGRLANPPKIEES